jgi:hypothetical protein
MNTNSNEIYSDWRLRDKTVLGDWGEDKIKRELESLGFVVDKPNTRHYDFFATKGENKFLFDVKIKAKRYTSPISGVNLKHFEDYKHAMLTNHCHFLIFFIDRVEKETYILSLRNFINNRYWYKIEDAKQPDWKYVAKHIYWRLEDMSFFNKLSKEEIVYLEANSDKRYNSYYELLNHVAKNGIGFEQLINERIEL